MKIIGLDYGLKKVGLAVAQSRLADPLGVVKYDSEVKLIQRLLEIIASEKADKIIVGLSEGQMAKKTKTFGEKLKKETSIPVEYFDETLSTQEAQRLSRESGTRRSKRQALEDAFAAVVMLQGYLDSH